MKKLMILSTVFATLMLTSCGNTDKQNVDATTTTTSTTTDSIQKPEEPADAPKDSVTQTTTTVEE